MTHSTFSTLCRYSLSRPRQAAVVALLVSSISTGFADIPIYSNEEPPPTSDISELPLQTTVTQHGITWTFSEPERVGRFVNGDYYVVGPATVVAIDPPPANWRNGSVLNLPANDTKTGFDSRTPLNRYDASLRSNPPIAMTPGDSLVSTISLQSGGAPRVLYPSNTTPSLVKTASVLTCMDAPVPPDAFRPSYCDRNNRIFLSRNLKRSLLPKLDAPASAPTLAEFEGYFQRPWIDTLYFGVDAPADYMPNYGREVSRATSMASLLLMLDFTDAEKEALLVYFTQYGIDLYGTIQAGHRGWRAHGGHGSGRKGPIVLAGLLFGDTGMQGVDAEFGEDIQTGYGQSWTGANVVFTGHKGTNGSGSQGPYEHLQPQNWPGLTGEDYRRCCTSSSWVGTAVTMHLMNGKEAWDHPAFFDYVDRWMTEDDTEFRQIIRDQRGKNYGFPQKEAWDDFVTDMYQEYRNTEPPTGGTSFSEEFPALLPGADDNGDGLSNFKNYASGTDPTQFDPAAFPDFYSDGSGWFLRYSRRPDAEDVVDRLEKSLTLETWSPSILGEDHVIESVESAGPGREEVIIRLILDPDKDSCYWQQRFFPAAP